MKSGGTFVMLLPGVQSSSCAASEAFSIEDRLEHPMEDIMKLFGVQLITLAELHWTMQEALERKFLSWSGIIAFEDSS